MWGEGETSSVEVEEGAKLEPNGSTENGLLAKGESAWKGAPAPPAELAAAKAFTGRISVTWPAARAADFLRACRSSSQTISASCITRYRRITFSSSRILPG